jgi:hypothetical protein
MNIVGQQLDYFPQVSQMVEAYQNVYGYGFGEH